MIRMYGFWLLLLLLLSAVFINGLKGDFLFDDGPNIVLNKAIQIPSLQSAYLREAAFSYGDGSGVGRPLPMLSLAFNYYFFGVDPFYYKLFNMVIHIANSFLILCLLIILQKATPAVSGKYPNQKVYLWMPCFVSAVWLVTPINLSPVLYVVQRMTSMETFFALLSLVIFVVLRHQILAHHYKRACILAALFVLASLFAFMCKETAILIPVFVLLFEIFFFGTASKNSAVNITIRKVIIVFSLTPVLLIGVKFLMAPDWVMESYTIRDFTLTERLLTEGRVLWFYFVQTVIPNNGSLGLYHDDWMILFRPKNGFIEVLFWLGWVAILCYGIRIRKKNPYFGFGVAFFLVGHSFEATFIGLELVHEHRNYLPSLGVIITVYSAVAGMQALKKVEYVRVGTGVASVYVFLLAASVFFRANFWSDLVVHAEYELKNHPKSLRANYQYARVLLMTAEKLGDEAMLERASDQLRHCAAMDKSDVLCLSGTIFIEGKYSPDADLKNKLLDEFVERVATGKIHQVAVFSFQSILKYLSKDEMLRFSDKVLTAIISNPYLSDRSRSSWCLALASIYFQLEELDKSAKLYTQALEYSGGNPRAILELAKFYIGISEYDKAVELLAKLNNTFYAFKTPSVRYHLDLAYELKARGVGKL